MTVTQQVTKIIVGEIVLEMRAKAHLHFNVHTNCCRSKIENEPGIVRIPRNYRVDALSIFFSSLHSFLILLTGDSNTHTQKPKKT